MRLTNREEEVMEYLWDNGPSFVKDIISSFEGQKPHYNTISTIVRNLEQKGLVSHEDFGTTYRYFAAITKTEYGKLNLKLNVKKYFNNSYKSLFSFLVESEDLTIDEIKELIDIANKKEQ